MASSYPSPQVDLTEITPKSVGQTERQQAGRLAVWAEAAYPAKYGLREAIREVYTGRDDPKWEVAYHDTDRATCLLAWTDSTLIVAICGTKSEADVRSDLTVSSVTIQKLHWVNPHLRPAAPISTKLHAGFAGRALLIYDIVREYVGKVGEREVFLTGHSLGGAAATCLALLCGGEWNINSVATFGSPKCVKHQSLATMKPTIRTQYAVERLYDLVPAIPYWTFEHPNGGIRTVLDGNDTSRGKRTVGMKLARAAYYLWQARRFFQPWKLLSGSTAADAHAIHRYVHATSTWR